MSDETTCPSCGGYLDRQPPDTALGIVVCTDCCYSDSRDGVEIYRRHRRVSDLACDLIERAKAGPLPCECGAQPIFSVVYGHRCRNCDKDTAGTHHWNALQIVAALEKEIAQAGGKGKR